VRRFSIAFVAVTLLFTGCEHANHVSQNASAVVKIAKRRIPIVRDIIEAALLAMDVVNEIASGEDWKTAVVNGFREFVGLDVKNDLEEKLGEMTDHEIDCFYNENRDILDPLIDERLQQARQ
jgi:hypothetical protein